MPAISTVAHSPQSIQEIMNQFQGLVAGMQEVADTMKRLGIESMDVDYQKSLLDSMDSLRRWSGSLHSALAVKLTEIGAFQAPHHGSSPRGKEGAGAVSTMTAGSVAKKRRRAKADRA